MCVYKDEWTEVQWNKETKTYTVGARIPQLVEYNTEGSDIQVLVDEELEKTSEEDNTLDVTGWLAGGQENCQDEGMSAFDPQDW